MWKCHKCGKPVYFAERKQSLGYDWHPECLRCEECGKRLNPGQHAEHKGVPYCHVPCYGALFGPQLFGHGTRVESHKSFGQKGSPRPSGNGPNLPRDHLESKLKLFNQFYDNKSTEIRSREVNGRLVMEGALKVYWGVHGIIHLKEDDDQRPVVTVRKRNSGRYGNSLELSVGQLQDLADKEDANDEDVETPPVPDNDSTDVSMTESLPFDTCSLGEANSIDSNSSSLDASPAHCKSSTLPPKMDLKQIEWDEIDDLLQVERKVNETDKLYQTMPSPMPSQMTDSSFSTQPSSSEIQSPSSPTVTVTSTTSGTDTFSTATDTTPSNTLKAIDFEDFTKQIGEDYINGTNEMTNVDEGTLKLNQPIDPSRINDSLKLYSENMMSWSFNGEPSMRMHPNHPGIIDALKINDTFNSGKYYALQKSGSASANSQMSEEERRWVERGINRSKSGPNCFGFADSDDCETLKPSTVRRTQNYKRLENSTEEDTEEKAGAINSTTHLLVNGGNVDNNDEDDDEPQNGAEVVLRRRHKTGSTAIKRRSGNKRSRAKLKRRCSINGHFYNRETSFFTPPHGSQMSVWVTSLVSTQEVINLLLEKYKVDSRPENFALFIIRDNGEQRRLKEEDYPLVTRIMLGPHEDVARIFLMDGQDTPEISCEVAQFLNLSIQECSAILDRYNEELDREVLKVKEKYSEMRDRIVQRMESLKVRL